MNISGQLLNTTSRITMFPGAIGLRPYIGAGDSGTVTDTAAPATAISLQYNIPVSPVINIEFIFPGPRVPKHFVCLLRNGAHSNPKNRYLFMTTSRVFIMFFYIFIFVLFIL